MGLLSEYFMNGATFTEATSLFTDDTLSTYAPDGMYSKDGISRTLTSGILGSVTECAECAPDCGGDFITVIDGGIGTWLTTFSASDAVGAVLIELRVGADVAIGFKAEYNSTTYNTICSVTEGLLESSNATRPTYIGESSGTFGPFSFTGAVNEYTNGEYVNLGTQTHVQLAGDDQRTTMNPERCYMLIPKFSTTPDPINVIAETFNSGETNFAIRSFCPQLLTQFAISARSLVETQGDACGLDIDGTKFHFPISGTAAPAGELGTVGLHDFVANDAYGAIPLLDGHYRVADGKAIEVEAGIVIALTDCV